MLQTIASAIFGLIIGSFLSVCIYRIPLGRASGVEGLTDDDVDGEQDLGPDGEASDKNSPFFDRPVSISYPPRSFCPKCGVQLRWFHNIPLFSWLVLGGRCAYCKAAIPMRYPLVELSSAFFCVLSFQMFAPATAVIIYLFAAALLVLSFIDLDYYLLPNVITYPGIVVGILAATVNQFYHLFEAPIVPDLAECAIGIVSGSGFLLLISEGYFRLRGKLGLGLGDVKLLAMIGALFGLEAAFYSIFMGSLVGSVVGIGCLLFARNRTHNYLPFGPYLAVAAILYVFTGPGFLAFTLQGLHDIVFGVPL